MLEDSRHRSMEDLFPKILSILARNKNIRIYSDNIADELKTETEEINRAFEEMKYLKLIELYNSFGPRYYARITPMGLANIEENNNPGEKKNE
jgi:hypothetical protein